MPVDRIIPGGSSRIRSEEAISAIYPFLIALYPILSLLSENIQYLNIADVSRSVALSFGMTALLLLVFSILLADLRKAAVLVSIILLAFFSHGHIYDAVRNQSVLGFVWGRHRMLLLFWVLLLGFVFVLLRNRPAPSMRFSQVMILISAGLVFVPLLQIGAFFLSSENEIVDRQTAISMTMEDQIFGADGTAPDIYFIVLDAYAREDVLKENYDYDNSQFIDYLRNKGFYVADDSYSNYLWTGLSLTSTLNLDYVDHLEIPRPRSGKAWDTTLPLLDSRVRLMLESMGYATVAFPTGYRYDEMTDAAYYLTPEMTQLESLAIEGRLNSFEGILLTTTAVRVFLDLDQGRINAWFVDQLQSQHFSHRLRVLSTLKHLENVPSIPEPKFVYAHIISPHSPYLFGPEGEDITQEVAFTFVEEGSEEDEAIRRGKYRDQLIFINSQITEVIDSIILNSTNPPIIILQSDHGPSAETIVWEDPSVEHLHQRSAILNALYLPENCDDQLYPQISPVNSFRLIFACALGLDYDLLSDQTFYSNARENAFDLRLITP